MGKRGNLNVQHVKRYSISSVKKKKKKELQIIKRSFTAARMATLEIIWHHLVKLEMHTPCPHTRSLSHWGSIRK